MATRTQDISRFFSHYQKFIVLIGVALSIQIFLAIRVALLPGGWDVSGDGSKGPYNNHRNYGSHKHSDLEYVSKRSRELLEDENNVAQNGPQAVKNAPAPNSSHLTLDLESLSFDPQCDITSRDTISAINRAKTQLCKEEISNLYCDIGRETLYERRLPRLCKNSETKYGRYLGCFKDNPTDRLLSGHLSLFKDRNSPQKCVDLCLQSGFQYAGLQYGVECFCGNAKPSSSVKLDNSACDMECSDQEPSFKSTFINPDDIELWSGKCGGYFTMDVFETGVFQDQEYNNNIVGLDGRRQDGNLAEKPSKTAQVVFFLTLNGRSVRQVFRLIKILFQEKHYIYIHVDSRQDYLYRELLALNHILPNNVRFMKNRKATIWGGASLLTVLLAGMEDLVTNAEAWNWTWDYVINLSESDFPLKSTERLEAFLSHNRGRNFVKSHGRDVQKFIQKQGLDKTFYECEHRMWRVADRKVPLGVMIDGGSDWIALHRDFIEYITQTDDQLVSGLKTFFKYTLLPAESFFHTTLRNSNHCRSFVDNNLHVTNWKRKLGCKCQYKNVVDWCGCSPNDFRLSDWNRLVLAESRILFFGRKFEAVVNQGIINKLESWLYPHRFETHYPTLDRFWLSLYHYHDLSPKPDDVLITLGRSLARIAARAFATKYNCTISHEESNPAGRDSHDVVELVEITAHNQDDNFQGVLIRYNSPMTKHNSVTPEVYTVALESWFQLTNMVTVAPWSKEISKYRSKIQDIAVGIDYDQKEQVFRSLARNIGPFSEPYLTYSIATDEPFNITAVFVDPSNSVQAVHNGTVGEGPSGTLTNFIKPVLKTPLQPGKWNVKILSIDGYLLAEVKMLVLPLEVYQAKKISRKHSMQINSRYSTAAETSQAEESDEIGELQDWIDNLVSEFYAVQDFCLESEQNHLLLSKWSAEAASIANSGSQGQSDRWKSSRDGMDVIETSLCSHAQWSSLFPDPKSTISGIDPETGLLLP